MPFKPETLDVACKNFREALEMMGAAPAGSPDRFLHAFDMGVGPAGERFSCLVVLGPSRGVDDALQFLGDLVAGRLAQMPPEVQERMGKFEQVEDSRHSHRRPK